MHYVRSRSVSAFPLPVFDKLHVVLFGQVLELCRIELVQHLRVRQVPVEERTELLHHLRSWQARLHQLEDQLRHLLRGDVLAIRPHVLLQLPERDDIRAGL